VIRTVTLNPAVDRTVTIPRFAVDAVNRVAAARSDAGGKGINVSKALRALGGRSIAYGFLGGNAGRFIAAFLDAQGIERRFAEIDGETRTNLKVVDPELGTHTDINEAGPPVGAADLDRLEAALFADLRAGDLLVLSGSVGSAPASVYSDWIRRARKLGALTLLDADGAALSAAAAAKPTAMKPNVDELGRLVGKALTRGGSADVAASAQAARSLLGGGTELVVVSLGAEGALFVSPRETIRAHGIAVDVQSTVGAGDSLVAALALGMERGDRVEALVRPAVAAGTAAAATAGSAPFERAAVAAYEALVVYDYL
jgi:1-phosphofructokinase